MPSQAAIRPRQRRSQFASNRGRQGLCRLDAFRETILAPAVAAAPAASALIRVIRGFFPAFLFPARLLPLVLVALTALAPSALASGISWNLPSTPFASDDSYRFQYWTSEFEPIPISGASRSGPATRSGASASDTSSSRETFSIPLHIGFSPTSTYNSPIGYGFEFALFDSRLVWADDRSITLHMPDGNTETLSYDKRTGSLSGAGWLGQYDMRRNQATLKASCGWVLGFTSNRLTSMRSPEGVHLNITRAPGGPQQLLRSGSVLASLTPEFTQSGQKYYTLKYGTKKATLRLGTRPVLSRQKGDNGKVHLLPALVSIQDSGKKERPYVFESNALTVSGHRFQWDDNLRIARDGETVISFVNIAGIPCVKRTSKDGTESLHGREGSKSVSLGADGKLFLYEYMHSGDSAPDLGGRLQKVSQIHPDGRVELQKQIWYDMDGNAFKANVWDGNSFTTFFKKGNKDSAFDHAGKLLWSKEHDSTGRLIRFQSQDILFSLQYEKDGFVTLEREVSGSKRTVRLPQEAIFNLFPRNNF